MLKKGIFAALGLLIAVVTSGFLMSGSEPVHARRITLRGPVQLWAREVPADLAGPVELTWKTLADVQYKDIYVAELDAYYWKPTFGGSVKAMEGKDVFISGYMIPVDYDENFYVISRYPYANCFFCGGGGPESVVDLRFAGKHRMYKTDERLTFRGKLKLNADNIYEMNYILLGAVEYTP
ncbi:MAG: hypothetical protein ACK5XV_11265 [Flavobacteriales bacterium]|jgi:hypothetical protein